MSDPVGLANPVFNPDAPRRTSDAANISGPAVQTNGEGQHLPDSSEEGLSEEESRSSVGDEELQQEHEEETRQSRYLGAAQSQAGTQDMAALAAIGAVGSGSVVMPEATRSRDDPWLKPPPMERAGRSSLEPLPEYPSDQDDLVGVELQERERMEQMQAEAERDYNRHSGQQRSSLPPVWRKQEACGQQTSPFAEEREQQREEAHPPVGGAPIGAVAIDMGQEPGGAAGNGAGGNGGKDTPNEAMVKEQHAELLAELPADQQLVLEFRDICSYAVLGGMGAQAKFNMYLGKLDPLDWNYKYLNPVALARAIRSKGASMGHAMRFPIRSSSSWLPMALRRRRSAQDPGGAAGDGAASGDEEAGKGKGPTGKSGGLGMAKKSKHKDDKAKKQILFDISGRVLPGQVLALMGPSGSGKTSLLAVLGGRTPPKIKLEGQILVNGEKFTKATRKRIGFVLQDDVLYETLTVYETLMYAGMLRLPRTMTKAEKSARVEAVMSVLGIARSRDTIIGGFFRRGISGGERKRVSVGHELLINPAVLLLDEPTSGLDSTTALHLVNLLRDLASPSGHQSQSLLTGSAARMSEGHPMYYGDALRAADWFAHLGFGLPYGTNLADHILDCAMGEVAYDPSAPGASAASQTQGPACGAPYLHGHEAVRCLYSTFEAWYEKHPGGFSLGPIDHRKREEAKNEHEEKLQKAGMARERDQVAQLLDGVRLLLPSGGSFTGVRYSQQLKRPTGMSLAGGEEKGNAEGLQATTSHPLRSRRTSLSAAAKKEEDMAARQCLLGGRPKSVDLEWGGGAARGGGRSSKDLGGITRLPLVGRLLGSHRSSIEAADAGARAEQEEGKGLHEAGGSSSSSSGGGPQELLRVMQTPAPGQQPEAPKSGEVDGVATVDGNDKDRSSKGAKAAAKGIAPSPSKAPASMGLDSAPGQAVKGTVGKALDMVGIDMGKKEEKVPDLGARWHTQLYILLSRALTVRRFDSFSGQQLFQLLAVSIITGLLWFQRGRNEDISAGADIMGLLFFELLFPSFRSLFSALFTFPNEFRMLSKERPSGMYKLSAYYWARVGADLPMELALPTIFVVIVYWLGGLRATAGAFFANWASLMLVITLAQSWGLLIGGVCMDPKQAQTVTTVVMLTFLLVGGFYVKGTTCS
ncbi:hypothetical protein DUNSADRAFT_16957 [Dunaliella salina]|uniref:ABC transporter domain-containing protein n=1 Tax=Dunaliella salina TaxID=3046 RepID=A0ABQ7G2N9_DUNSA|nr:hypothetical protein DUNSADRAFT_16957 [Dunaliella salina]|eukprot:KAF5828872.1 hypothetical protein DUNSADRAFT_16957 [Dunaliella salina]